MSQLKSRNAVVFGVSTDTVDSHKQFVDKYNLNFDLLADTDKKLSEAYGALMPNGMSNRYTFIIGPDGRIMHIDRNVNGQFERADNKLSSRHGTGLALLMSDWKAAISSPVP